MDGPTWEPGVRSQVIPDIAVQRAQVLQQIPEPAGIGQGQMFGDGVFSPSEGIGFDEGVGQSGHDGLVPFGDRNEPTDPLSGCRRSVGLRGEGFTPVHYSAPCPLRSWRMSAVVLWVSIAFLRQRNSWITS
mgnify:CR=1 FL=1